MCIYIYIYIHTHTHTQRYRDVGVRRAQDIAQGMFLLELYNHAKIVRKLFFSLKNISIMLYVFEPLMMDQSMETSSTSKISLAFGGILGGG